MAPRGIGQVIYLATLLTPLSGCPSTSNTPPSRANASSPPVVALREPAPALQPHVPSRAPQQFVGAARCAECHKKEHRAWSKDWHRRALSPAVAPFVVGDFRDARFAGRSNSATMHRVGGRPMMKTADEEQRVGDFSVDWVIGGKRMQDTVHVFPDGRWQVLPVYYHVDGARGGAWVDYTEAKQGALDRQHPFFWTNFHRLANRECLDCHVSGLEVKYDPVRRRFDTKFANPGVGCESCHGAGGRHAESTEPEDIFSPKEATRAQRTALCGQCHGPRNPLFPLFDHARRFRPGEAYEDSYDPVVVLIGDRLSGDFFVDGRPQTSSFEYQAMIQSRCYRKSELTCLTCHTAPHQPHGAAELRGDTASNARQAGDRACHQCHAEVVAAGRAHTHHSKASCVDCHMPPTISGVLDKFADHAIDVPNPRSHERHGIPDACGVCHPGRPSTELQAWLVKSWPRAAGRQLRRARLAEAFATELAETSAPSLLAVIADEEEAASLRGAALVLLAQRFPARVAPVASPLLGHLDPLVRLKAATALGVAHAVEARAALTTALADRALPVVQAAALALASFADERGLAALAQLAAGEVTQHLVQPHLVLGMTALGRGDPTGALPHLERALALAPYSVDALVLFADAQYRSGHPEAARAPLEEALRFDPSSEPVQRRLATLDAAVAR